MCIKRSSHRPRERRVISPATPRKGLFSWVSQDPVWGTLKTQGQAPSLTHPPVSTEHRMTQNKPRFQPGAGGLIAGRSADNCPQDASA